MHKTLPTFIHNLSNTIQTGFRRFSWKIFAEILLITFWAMLVGRIYFNLDPYTLPSGGDYPLQIYNHYTWNNFSDCGICVLWNGSTNGGMPAFSEIQGATLHPLVILTTIGWGVINGSKMMLLASLIMFGIGQWWLAYVMGVKRPIRIWAGLLAVVAGSVASRIEGGLLNIVFSAANATLIFPPMIEMYLRRTRRSIILTAVFFGLTLVSGQGYLQLGFIAAILPASLILFLKSPKEPKPMWKDFLLAFGIGVLFAAVFWVPMLHFGGNFTKDGNPVFDQTNHLNLLPLNLVLPYKLPDYHNWPSGFRQYLGWIPIILAVFSLRTIPREKNRLLLFFWAAIGLVLLISSSDFLLFLYQFLPDVAVLRFPINMLCLATPLLIALAAWSFDHIQLKAPIEISLHIANWSLRIPVLSLGIFLLMAWPIYDNVEINSGYLQLRQIDPSYEALTKLKTDDTQWVSIPNTNYDLGIILLENDYKYSGIYRPFWWKNRQTPPAYLEATDIPELANSTDKIGMLTAYTLLLHPQNYYASVSYSDGSVVPCVATAKGGNIDVRCALDKPGVLRVYENKWDGWWASIDGQTTPLKESAWLEVQAPAGAHFFEFRYRPWDVWLGLLINLIGIGLAIWVAKRKN